MRTQADKIYLDLLSVIMKNGDNLEARNGDCYSHWNLPNVTFTEFPLVTVRKTAAMKAIREMEWFLSGIGKCPDELLDWWTGQLNPEGLLLKAYPDQFRYSSSEGDDGYLHYFDQIEFIINELKTNPNSRRLLMCIWNPGEMANITETNENPNTPTVCHSVIVQFFVRSGKLNMKSYQRSADALLGVPHNWVQSWAMLMYFAHHSGLKVGSMTWVFGDAHIYNEESHLETVRELLYTGRRDEFNATFELEYTPTVDDFLASDFKIIGSIPEPITTIRPKLL